MKIDRLIGILSILLQEEKITAPQLLQLWINFWKIVDTAMTLAMADFTMRYICPMQERLLLRNGRL